jgi:hypothetical protein
VEGPAAGTVASKPDAVVLLPALGMALIGRRSKPAVSEHLLALE